MSTFPAQNDRHEVELGAQFQPKFGPDGLIPCIAQDHETGEVLMFAFMNEESLGHTLQTGKATYWSRSRSKLWMKGEESGNVQLVREVRAAKEAGMPFLLIHETEESRGGCEFQRFFDVTPPDLVKAGLYRQLAIAWHQGSHLLVSRALAAEALGGESCVPASGGRAGAAASADASSSTATRSGA